MNKFVLSVLVILAIGMAELPSIFGCNQLPIIAAPRSGSAATSWFIQHHLNGAIGADTRSVDAGGNVFELELEGFSICNTDGTEGLTFDEINACQVNNNFTQYVDTYT